MPCAARAQAVGEASAVRVALGVRPSPRARLPPRAERRGGGPWHILKGGGVLPEQEAR